MIQIFEKKMKDRLPARKTYMGVCISVIFAASVNGNLKIKFRKVLYR